ncbi:right-handed parallel beta-helix repeat-containing protein [Paraglaciecola sp. L3A3]|uniref:right-handed parallel beta-helix repeat-containing protein n=1 Tax=Paraglaciecola sp. L3A3 TaxID=2686358 RepID=UPI00131CEE6A|nr:right-handed parallel beta-helix repeat-containing protein [Paraglaciecola sp. L3A3]
MFKIKRIQGQLFCGLLFSSLALSLSVNAKTLYVATDGDDSNDGQMASPLATFSQANSLLEAGDTLIIKAGVYRQTLQVSKSGNEQSPILIKAEDNAEVIIRGTEPVSGWSVYQGNIYQANVNSEIEEAFRQLYHKDEIMDIARWPNNTDGDLYTIDAAPLSGKGTVSSVNADNIPDSDLTGGYIWYLGAHSGASWTRQISSSTTDSVSFTAIDDTKWPFNPHAPTIQRHDNFGRFFVFGKLALLDHKNEWFYDAEQQIIYLQTADGQAPADNEVEIASRQNAVILDGQYISIEGLEIFGANVRVNGNNNTIKNNKIYHGLERMDDLTNSSAQVGDGSINVLGTHTTITDNVIEHGSLNGIFVAGWSGRGQYVHIENNTIQYFDTLGIHASPLRVNANDATILRNTVAYTGRDGVFLPSQNSELGYNDVSRVGLINNDGGVFYTVGNDDNKNTRIHHNWFHDSVGPSYADGRTAGIYLDNNSKGYQVDHNVVWNVTWAGVQLNWANWNNNIYHNTIINAGQAMGEWVNGYTRQDNRVWNNYTNVGDWLVDPAYDLDSNLIETEQAQLIDPEQLDFMPLDTSLLIDQGRTIDDFEKPFAGPSPDIGAYELGGVKWTAGVNAILDDCTECQSNPDADPVVEPAPEPTTPEPTTPEPTTPSTDNSSGGGSFGFSLIGLALCRLFWTRRKSC